MSVTQVANPASPEIETTTLFSTASTTVVDTVIEASQAGKKVYVYWMFIHATTQYEFSLKGVGVAAKFNCAVGANVGVFMHFGNTPIVIDINSVAFAYSRTAVVAGDAMFNIGYVIR